MSIVSRISSAEPLPVQKASGGRSALWIVFQLQRLISLDPPIRLNDSVAGVYQDLEPFSDPLV